MVGENLKNAIRDLQKFQMVITFIEESLGGKNKTKDTSKEIVIGSQEDEKTLILKTFSIT